VSRTRIVGLAILTLLCAPDVARAERGPTPRERTAIEGAARHAYADHYFKVRVSRIEVSTVDRRWATAVVATLHRREPHPSPQRRQESFYRTERGWVAWFNTAMPDVDMPIDVERDLGFAGPAPLFGISGKTAVWIVIGVIALIMVTVARVRLGGSGAGEGGGPRPVTTFAGGEAGSQGSKPEKPPTFKPPKRKCGACNGRGTVPPPLCLLCGGTGRIPNPNHNPGVPYIDCNRGHAAHQPHQCETCLGTGEV
jgi:hypothetical protein